MECLLPYVHTYICIVTVPHIMVGLERMLDYRGVRLGGFPVHKYIRTYVQYVHLPRLSVICYQP